jgi:TonB-linked SusC/RagA family outer membrane protein
MTTIPRYRALLSCFAVLIGVLGLTAQASAQAVFRGKVTSEKSGEPLVGATVVIGELTLSTLTNAQGQFVLTVPAARANGQQVTLTARAIGYKSVARVIPSLTTGERTVEFALAQDINKLEEIVVTGTLEGTERAKVAHAVTHLNAEDLPVPSTNPITALEGKVAGLRIASTSGRPGASPEIMLRGPTSINGTGRSQEPLIIVDGVIMHVGSVQELGGLDIESVEVVKGAAGASLYGTQAANGVITITTKRGLKGQDGIKFNARTEWGFSDFNSLTYGMPVNHPLQLDETGTRFCVITSGTTPCSRTVDLMTEMFRINNVNADTIRTPLGILYNVPSLNDLRNVYQYQIYPVRYFNSLAQIAARHPTSITSLDATGRVGSVGFYVSGQYTDDPGATKFFEGNNQRRARLNLDYSARSDLKFSFSSMFDNSYRDNRNSGIFGTILRGAMPGFDMLARDTLGRLLIGRGGTGWRPTGNGGANPLYDAENTTVDQTANRFLGSVNANYFPAPWVTFDANFGYDIRTLNQRNITAKGYRTNTINQTTNFGNLRLDDTRDEALNGTLSATLRKRLRSDLEAKLRLQGSYDQEKFLTDRGSGAIFLVKDVYTLDNLSTNQTITSSNQVIKNAGASAAASLDFKDRYVLDGSFRYDGSSLFGPGHRWAPFNRIAGVWILSNEPWWHVGWLDQIRFRGSRGTAGNTPRFNAQYEVFNVAVTGISTGQAGNAALRPETTTEYEGGTELTLFKRLGIEVNYAQGTTKDQILPVNVPAAVGYSSQWQNAGTLLNKTWEVAMTLPLVNSKSFYWQTRATWDRTRSYISELFVPDFLYDGGTAQGTGSFFYFTADSRRQCLPGEVGHLPGESGYGPGEARASCTGPQLNRYGNIYGRRFFRSCSELEASLRSRCGEGKDFQVNDEGWLVYAGAGNSWKDGITRNLWNTSLPASQSPWGVALAWGHPILDRPLAGQPGQGVGINQVIGNVFPDFRFTFSNDFQWKKLTLYALVDATIGQDIYNQGEGWGLLDISSSHFDQMGKSVETAKPVGYSWRVGPSEGAGTGGFYDILGPNNYVVESGSFAKLREVSLTYRLGRLAGVGDWTVGVVGRNLHTFTKYTGYDPEVGCGSDNTGTGGAGGCGGGGSTTRGTGSGLINSVDAFGFPTLRTVTFSLSTRF